MDPRELKRQAAAVALEDVEDGMVLGIGTGSTVNELIGLLGDSNLRLDGAVSSSEATTRGLESIGVRVLDLNSTGPLELYIDGADETDPHGRLITGGGGALTREKVIAAASRRFSCIVDDSKCVSVLGEFPLPVEVIPMARSHVARQLVELGGRPELRDGFVTDNGNPILDVRGLDLTDPVAMEKQINQVAGVVTVGLFAVRPADRVIVASAAGVRTL
ncbi:MAG: ribose-5-phosphate isomerase RpiA [Pseudomonadota bacterium]